jgi:hypothetical protein
MRRWIQLAVVALAGVVLMGASCGKPHPQPPTPPTPTPPPVETGRPTTPVFTNLVLRQSGGRFTSPFNGAIPCWPTDGTGEILKVDGRVIPYWWSLTSPEWIDHIKEKGASAVHLRLGPAAGSEACCGMQDVGGPYTMDGTDWNQPYWDRLHSILRHAGEKGILVELDLLDGWVIKHALAGDVKMPWSDEDVHRAMIVPFSPATQKWLEKVVFETCPYGNLVYQVGNENDLTPGWSETYERAVFDFVRQRENGTGCNGAIVHMVGSNTVDYGGPYDYFSSHSSGAELKPIGGRPISVNEYNPHLAPATYKDRLCEAQATGQAFWYWRSDGTDSTQDESLALIKAPCGAGGCTITIGDIIQGMTSATTAPLNAAKAAVGDVCGKPPEESLTRLAAQLTAQGECATKDEDRVFIRRPDGNADEQHAVAYTDGCWAGVPYRYTFAAGGGSCSNPSAQPVTIFAAAWRNGWYDATPLRQDHDYCVSIGMGTMGGPDGQPRGICPIRNECPDTPGYEGKCEQRIPCEQVAMGGFATWQGDGQIEVNPGNANHLQARCPNCTWLKVCNADGSTCSEVKLQ